MKDNLQCRFWNLFSILFLVILFIYPAINYSDLPDTIPSHYNFWGVPDDYSSKNTIWILPVIGLLLYVTLTLISNKLIKPKIGDPQYEYQKAQLFLQRLLFFIMISFFYIVYTTIQIAMGSMEGLPRYFSSIFILLILFMVIS
ncbi:MAG: DUF1648 domain-containing protein, partial [Bacteroidia bacterium]|nr:DUF1648 domain-containing protein [Bacteroidia bacterium]